MLSKHKDTVRGHVSTGEDSVRELYTYLMGNYLPTRYPTIFKLSDDRSSLMNLVTNDVCPTTPLSDASEALGHIGTTVEEDMFLLKPAPDGHQCVAFVCCFPSGWNPASKLGKHMTQIHSGVPGYEKISPSIERFFTKLQVGKSVHRVNVSYVCHATRSIDALLTTLLKWTVQTHADLFNAKSNHVREDEKVQEEDIEIEKASSHTQTLLRPVNNELPRLFYESSSRR